LHEIKDQVAIGRQLIYPLDCARRKQSTAVFNSRPGHKAPVAVIEDQEMNLLRNAALAAILLSGAISGPVAAATVDIGFTSFSRQDISVALAGRDAFIGAGPKLSEDFESGFTPCDETKNDCTAGTILSSQLGSFTGFGGAAKKGASQVQPRSKIVVRTGADGAFGRYNVTPGGLNWLDSNDREGIDWSFAAPGDLTFRRLAFLLTDLDDMGSILFNISVNGALAVARPGAESAGDGQLHLITLLFDTPVSSFEIRLVNGKGDGFGLDGARLAAVPLPAAGLLLLATLCGLALLARRGHVT
jgi:hypothetical protein